MDASYNENCDVQRHAFEHFWPWLEDAVINSTALLPFKQTNSLISYADYGCAGGGNSATHFTKIKAMLEQAGFFGGVSEHTYLFVIAKICLLSS